MNRFQIRDILKAHKEHFRVLPTLAENELNGIITAIDTEETQALITEEKTPKVKETKRVVGNRTSKATKNPKRSRR